MTSPITKQAPRAATSFAQHSACTLLLPAGLGCSKPYGHEPPCAPVQNTEPPAPDPMPGPAPAASSAPRQYGFKRREEADLELPSGSFVRVRKLSTSQVLELGVLNMRDAFSAELLGHIDNDEPPDPAEDKPEDVFLDPERRVKLLQPLDRVIQASVICPTVVWEGKSSDTQIHVDEIEMVDKWVIFEAAMPDELKTAALEAQHDALKSLRTEQTPGV